MDELAKLGKDILVAVGERVLMERPSTADAFRDLVAAEVGRRVLPIVDVMTGAALAELSVRADGMMTAIELAELRGRLRGLETYTALQDRIGDDWRAVASALNEMGATGYLYGTSEFRAVSQHGSCREVFRDGDVRGAVERVLIALQDRAAAER